MGNLDEPLRGFSWRSGTYRETTGIVFWSDVFLYDNPNGEKLAILVVDTQGLFDNQTTSAENSRIFSLSMLLSSIQMFNLQGLVQEDHLEYLQFATEFAKFTSSNQQQDYKPFQSFLFLMRDWNSPDEFPFGFAGGKQYLDDLLVVKPNHTEQLKSVRKFINASFDNLSCCLLPYPGQKVARDSNYDGRWSLMDEDFLNELKTAIPKILSPQYLITKKINNIEMNGKLVNEYFQQFIGLYQAGISVQPQSIYETTVDKFNMAIVAQFYEMYKTFVKIGTETVQLDDENDVTFAYSFASALAIIAYFSEKKMGSEDHEAKYLKALKDKMEKDSIEGKAMALTTINRVRQERQRAAEAAREAERLRLRRIEQDRLAQEYAAQAGCVARSREAARQRNNFQ